MCIRSGCWTFLTYKNSVCQQHGPSRFSRLSLLVVKKPEAEIIRSQFFPSVPAPLFVLYLLEREAHIPYGRRCEQVKFRQTAAQKSTPANLMDAVNSSIAPKDLLLVHKRDFHEETETNLYQEMSAFYWVSPAVQVHSCLIFFWFRFFLLRTYLILGVLTIVGGDGQSSVRLPSHEHRRRYEVRDWNTVLP
jgi:hypothetical protein